MRSEVNAPTNVWAATSPCTPRCVARTDTRVPVTRQVRRSVAVTGTVLRAFARGDRLAEPGMLRSCAADLLDAAGVRLDARGGPLSVPASDRGSLVVANHISWLDVIALLAIEPVTMLAKREVAGWPLIGPLVRRAGTLFIDRDSLRTLPAAIKEVSAALGAGRSVVVFPQGVTWCSGARGVFRRAAFQAAIDAGAPVRPVTIRYDQGGRPTTLPAFVGDDDFVTSLRRIVGAADVTVRVTVHPPLFPTPGLDDRRTLAARAQARMSGAERLTGPGGRMEAVRDAGRGQGAVGGARSRGECAVARQMVCQEK
ncbi:lysophospholipid acyltransferase family protein [Streptomyces sp. B6B3]|uniref:lysophospholipid acyltransferase family protein n=1 Tax=Streptomyces sp. B6B3 TaxID=3153570 RepID=UPI00325EFF4B